MNTIKFHNKLSINGLKNRKKLKEFIPKLCKAEGKKIDSISFNADAYGVELLRFPIITGKKKDLFFQAIE